MIGTTKCSKCGLGVFVLIHNAHVFDSEEVIAFIQCSSCQAPAGAIFDQDVGSKLAQLSERMEKMEGYLKQIASQLATS